ncbi:hypothetical protein NP233_g8744 [Leucocoprinus birnbaumii]|uniref:Integrase catalytic domain-containing protein n=1 Tax=Leucocoprinus birnbaumii TaxID=56174 RepID=A0AAD5VS91_9AGAR|nr:hypothetical protein NP233_g8744 [Leucocoprinus birnbaumii]
MGFTTPMLGRTVEKGLTFEIIGQGTVSIAVDVGGKNLISIPKVCSLGYSVFFGLDEVLAKHPSGAIVLQGIMTEGLYQVPVAESPKAYLARSQRNPTSLNVWHHHFGHAGVESIKNMARKGLVDGLDVVGDLEMKGSCEDCIFGKMHARPYDEEVVPEKVLECLHIDLWGPSPVISAGGSKYFMLIMDGASSFRAVEFLKEKTAEATLQVLRDFVTHAERLTGRPLIRHGFTIDFTTAYVHQQNRAVERSMRIVLDGARSMLAELGLPTKFWPEAVRTAVYIRNLIPSKRHPDIVPAEKWYGRKQDITHLHPFGATAYTYVSPETSTSKLAARATRLTMIGYLSRGSYKLLERETGSIFSGRNIRFEEGETNFAKGPERIEWGEDKDPFPLQVLEERLGEVRVMGEEADGARNEASGSDPRGDGDSSDAKVGNAGGDNASVASSEGEVEDLVQMGNVQVAGEVVRVEGRLALVEDEQRGTLVASRARREPKPSRRLIESREYLAREARGQEVDEGQTESGEDRIPGAFAVMVGGVRVPQTFREAMMEPEAWWEPMVREINVMKARGVYELVERPVGENIIDPKWVYALKFDGDGALADRKSRIVAKGYTQIQGVDFKETYAATARLELFCLILAIVALQGLVLWQLNFVTVYLNSDIEFDVYMEQPQGFSEGGGNMVWKLRKTLYGTMQGGHDWFKTLSKAYKELGYRQSLAEPTIRTRHNGEKFTITCTYMDGTMGRSSDEAEAERAKRELGEKFEAKVMKEVDHMLGIKVEAVEEGIRISQKAYAKRMLEKFGMESCKPRSTPLPVGIALLTKDGPDTKEEKEEMKKVPYREALGSLMWLQVGTQPDLSYAVNLLSRFSTNTGKAHWEAMKHVMAYIRGTLEYGITYHRGASLQPVGFVDSDFANDQDTRRSTNGHIFFAGGGPVSWSTKRQERVATSTTEAEYMAISQAVQQAMWLSSFFDQVALPQQRPITLFIDNNGAIDMTRTYRGHKRMKHIDVHHHFVKEKVEMGEFNLVYVPSEDNVADLLTKPLP